MEAAFFRWLPIPELGMSEMEIERQLLQQNLSVYCSYRFTVMRTSGCFMRVAISSPADGKQLECGCNMIRNFIEAHRCMASE